MALPPVSTASCRLLALPFVRRHPMCLGRLGRPWRWRWWRTSDEQDGDSGLRVIAQQLLQAPRAVVQKVSGDAEVLGVLEGHLADSGAIELDDLCIRIGQQDGRRNRSVRPAGMPRATDRVCFAWACD